MGRFINADALVSTGQGILGNNMFAYCGNNPVGHSDDTGYLSKKVCMPESFGAEYKSPWHPPLRVPNARQFESYEEGVNATIDFVMGVYNHENVQNAKAINSIKSGIMTIKKGVGILLVSIAIPDPVPVLDEAIAFIGFYIYGSYQILSGMYQLTES